jgi:hypothetical protein
VAPDIVISANFYDGACPILAGLSEDTLQETKLKVSDVQSRPLNAVRALAGHCQTALVISRVNDLKKGWRCKRKLYRRHKKSPAAVETIPAEKDPG